MRRALKIVLVLLVVALSATTSRGSSLKDEIASGLAGRPQNAVEKRLFADAADGRLDEFSPLGAALVAGGVDNADELHRYQQKAKSLADELRQSDDSTGPRERIVAVFDFMHRRVLCGGYDLAATDLRVVLDKGRFQLHQRNRVVQLFRQRTRADMPRVGDAEPCHEPGAAARGGDRRRNHLPPLVSSGGRSSTADRRGI